ncbi:glutaredoxin-like protein [Corynebacterium pyruviciproducens ATCC BAA-1742]|uniref:Glutaredoxin-like protein n=1 Tax=Corynebacterium pyruviciproducens ATCC BAA-1742 TaxID=1125779 RepID=S2Z2T0_9CORY|nr:mycoredoxin [Corynebacterium pyruviciproducens]EPD71098.1 glutaredoxin-like protein [Corynebacterium pyruviciproducens ATCC BAA-1742]
MSTQHATIYMTDWCPYCAKLLKALDRTETPYTAVNVEEDESAAQFVESVNDGNRVVPTVHYSDGSTQTNPPASAVRQKLRELEGEEA